MLKIISCLAVVVGLVASARAAEDVKLTQEKSAVHVTIGGKPFTTYHVGSNDGKPYVRPFFYPVRAADGTPVTADQLTEGGDHPHHRSMYVAHGAVNGADHWALRGANSPKQRHVKFDKVEGDTIQQELLWEDKGGEPMLKENRTVRFVAYDDGSRGVDFTLVFEPVSGPVTFEDTKEAGLCTIRAAKGISQKGSVVISNATGASGERNIWGKPAKWCDISGKIEGKAFGIAILDHPSNPRHPSNWHVREYGLMGANVFGLHDFDKKNPAGTGNFRMEKGKPVTFKYRVVIHEGDAKGARLDEKWGAFAGK